MPSTIPQIPARTIPRSFDEWVMVLPTGPTIPLPPVAGQKLLAAPIIAGLLPATIPAALSIVDTISPTTGEVARVTALVYADPRIATLDPVVWQRAAAMLQPYLAQVIDFLTDQRDHSKLAGDGAHLLVGLKRIKAGQPDPVSRSRAERVIRDAVAPSQASKAQCRQQEILRFARLLVAWGICPDMPTLRDPVYAADPWKYEASIICPGGIIVNRRGPNPHQYLKGRCATSRAELDACKIELDQEYLRTEAAMRRRLELARTPADPIVVTNAAPRRVDTAARTEAHIARLNAELANAIQEGLARHADRTSAR